MHPKPFLVYFRVSSEEQREVGSIKTQEQEVRRWLEREGYDPDNDAHYVYDDGVSGRIRIWQRPGGRQVQAIIEGGLVTQAVILHSTDRANRDDTASWFLLVGLAEEFGLPVRTILDNVDTSTESGYFVGGINAIYARTYKRQMLAKTSAGKRRGASEGRWQGGRVPYGYRKNAAKHIEPDPSEALLILEWVKWIGEGMSLNGIANRLNDNGTTPPKRAQRWYASTIAEILANPVLYGEARYARTQTKTRHGKRTVTKRPASEHIILPCEGIMTRVEWRAVQEQIRANTRSLKKLAPFAMLDCVYCVHCNHRYYAWIHRVIRTNKTGECKRYDYPVYRHRTPTRTFVLDCPHIGQILTIKSLDAYIWQIVVDAAHNIEAWKRARRKAQQPEDGRDLKMAKAALAETKAAQKRLDKYARDFVMKGVPLPESFEALNKEVRNKMTRAENALADARAQAGDTRRRKAQLDELAMHLKSLARVLPTLDLAHRRELCRTLIKSVTLDKTKSTLPEMVRVHWNT